MNRAQTSPDCTDPAYTELELLASGETAKGSRKLRALGLQMTKASMAIIRGQSGELAHPKLSEYLA
jgi:hypothetical protein